MPIVAPKSLPGPGVTVVTYPRTQRSVMLSRYVVRRMGQTFVFGAIVYQCLGNRPLMAPFSQMEQQYCWPTSPGKMCVSRDCRAVAIKLRSRSPMTQRFPCDNPHQSTWVSRRHSAATAIATTRGQAPTQQRREHRMPIGSPRTQTSHPGATTSQRSASSGLDCSTNTSLMFIPSAFADTHSVRFAEE